MKSSPEMNGSSIGIFDSGIGGLTVMQQLIKALPREDMVYFGDTARLPYGGKSPDTIIRYSCENTTFLLEKNIKMLVVACSTASAHALEVLRDNFSLPIIGAVDPGAKKGVEASKNGRIGVLGTKGTIGSQAYQKAILELDPHAKVFPVACPLFVPLVEEQYVDHPATRLIVKEYLKTLEKDIDTLILGCTHYPLLKKLIADEMGGGVTIIDSAVSCAEQVAALLEQKDLCKTSGDGKHHYYVSDDPKKFQQSGRHFLGMPIDHVELV